MTATPRLLRLRRMSLALPVVLISVIALPLAAEAVIVDCNAGQTIRQALTLSGGGGGGGGGTRLLVITVRGICNENVLITRDDVLINTNGANPATIVAVDPSQAVIRVDGGRRIVIDGVMPNGIALSGGTSGLVATRGSTVSLANADISGATFTAAVVSSYGSTLDVDASVLRDSVRGGVAANNAQLVVTNSTVRNHANEGLLAVRSAYLRVGQDLGGSVVARPVTVIDNGTQGISVVDSSSATIVATTIRNNSSNGIAFTRGSAGTIGTGSNGLVSPNTIEANALGTLSQGIFVGRGSAALIQGNSINGNARGVLVNASSVATIIGNSIQNNVGRGVQVSESGSARIGVSDGATGGPGNTILGNGGDGIGVFDGAEAVVANNTITSNGGHGIAMLMATMNLVGGNTISGNTGHGISVVQSRLFQAPGSFGSLPNTVDVSQGNGQAGLFVSNNGSAELRRITLANNTRQGIGASLNSTINLGVYNPARPDDLVSITNNGTGNVANNNDGITLFSASMLTSPQNPGVPGQVIITGHPGWGVNCFGVETKAAVGMDQTGIAGNALGTVNCGGF
jgi:parallel beta-helix repeat protein